MAIKQDTVSLKGKRPTDETGGPGFLRQDGAAPKFSRRAEARPDEMLDAACELFLERGFAASRVEDIARRAGVSKGSIYRYFPSKQALIEGLVKREISPIAKNAIGMIGQFEGNPRDLISLILTMVAGRLNDAKVIAVPKLIMREAVSFPQIAHMYREEVLANMIPVFTQVVQKGVEGGYFRQVDAELTIRSIVGPIVVHLLFSEIFEVRPKDGLALDRLVNNHLSILFDGLSLKEGASNE